MAKSKIQLVLEDEIREKGEQLAKANGMNSYQDLIRYWTVQASRGNLEVRNRFVTDEFLSKEEEEILGEREEEFESDLKKGKIKTTKTLEDHFKYLGI